MDPWCQCQQRVSCHSGRGHHTTTRFPTRLTGLQVFEKEVEVFPVSTGTAANCQPSSPKTDCTRRVPDG